VLSDAIDTARFLIALASAWIVLSDDMAAMRPRVMVLADDIDDCDVTDALRDDVAVTVADATTVDADTIAAARGRVWLLCAVTVDCATTSANRLIDDVTDAVASNSPADDTDATRPHPWARQYTAPSKPPQGWTTPRCETDD
jgi:hypothetical protein